MNKVILIGGSPTAGKTRTAEELANMLKVPWISTDMIREQMRGIVDKNTYPDLFKFADADANLALEYLNNNPPSIVVEDEIKEGICVWDGVKALIETNYVWKSYIVEGIAILPELVKDLSLEDVDIRVLFLIDDDAEKIREKIFTRGLWDDADKYPDSVKEKEIEWVLAFNKFIKEEANKYNYPVIRVGNYTDHINKIMDMLK